MAVWDFDHPMNEILPKPARSSNALIKTPWGKCLLKVLRNARDPQQGAPSSPAGEGDSCPWEVHLELAAAGGPGAFSLSLTIVQRSPARPAAPSCVRKSWVLQAALPGADRLCCGFSVLELVRK